MLQALPSCLSKALLGHQLHDMLMDMHIVHASQLVRHHRLQHLQMHFTLMRHQLLHNDQHHQTISTVVQVLKESSCRILRHATQPAILPPEAVHDAQAVPTTWG